MYVANGTLCLLQKFCFTPELDLIRQVRTSVHAEPKLPNCNRNEADMRSHGACVEYPKSRCQNINTLFFFCLLQFNIGKIEDTWNNQQHPSSTPGSYKLLRECQALEILLLSELASLIYNQCSPKSLTCSSIQGGNTTRIGFKSQERFFWWSSRFPSCPVFYQNPKKY